ncbi:ABC transporter substrate-binding protein [Mesorhizobium sp.]|uniref:substrate-binding periplasmic protein n=1 Tax=Mesorhizobium sp. TaxID=1871066 RepID=UPI0025BFB956|nr:transporter substrate-binding domain-containing protein [Mesorhizobium sp.]
MKFSRVHQRARRLAGIAFAAGMLTATMGNAEDFKTIEPGKLHIAMNGDMPMTQLKDGKLEGLDGSLLAHIAEKLGLEPVVHQMDWAAEIEATKQGKVDVMLGAMNWQLPRTKIMNLTDPVYYFGSFLVQKSQNNYSTFADMKGKAVGTVTGFSIVPELKTVEGIGQVKLYDTSDGALQDLVAGRLDMALLDPPLASWAIVQHPEWKLKLSSLTPMPDKYPTMSGKHEVVFGVTRSEQPLADAISKVISGDIWPNCLNVKALAKYKMADKAWITPPKTNERTGVDRDAGWSFPRADHCF